MILTTKSVNIGRPLCAKGKQAELC